MRHVRYFSMFSGIGGFELGIEKAAKTLGIEAECVGYSEIDKHAIATYERHFNHDNYGDATLINPDALPVFDLLVGGFPCQAFSIGGKRLGFEEARGTLFFDIARILAVRQPRRFILENVKGLINHKGGETFRTILRTLDELGYDVQWQILNSKDYGVPQHRERVYLVGNLGGTPRPQVFPAPGARNQNPQAGRNQGRFGVVRNNYPGKPEMYVERPNGLATTIDANYWKGLDNHGARTGIAEVSIIEMTGHRSQSQRLYDPAGLSPTISTGGASTGGAEVPKISLQTTIRRLTPTECERLQGFSDGWTVGSDTQRYKQCGNAVSVPVVEYVAERTLA
ncbi:DNA (cytosine-5-)-methyltransferase [Paenarthrobacter sp. CAP02]|uniref:DNA (cytosine-5-)-methyltransferase n=1 Tax=Paenarthrobacter sp. CAP02 TaxID=3158144 RepID=UPI0032DA24F4